MVGPNGEQRPVTFQAGVVGAERTQVLSGLFDGQEVVLPADDDPGRGAPTAARITVVFKGSERQGARSCLRVRRPNTVTTTDNGAPRRGGRAAGQAQDEAVHPDRRWP